MSRPPRRRRVALVIAIAIMITATILASQLFRPLKEAHDFYVPDAAEASAARRLFGDLLDGKPTNGRIRDLGLETYGVRGGVPSIALREEKGDCRGRGVYRLREGPAAQLALVAPHSGSDRLTGELVTLLFEEGPVRAAAWNSAPRRVSADCPGGGDATRVETHFLTAFSLAFADAHPDGRVVQLHGFDQGKRTSRAAQLADIVISDGSDRPAPRLLDLADCLSVRLHPIDVALYPVDTRELGATTNRQGRALRAEGFDGFAHIELSAPLRQRLIDDAALRGQFAACLTEGLA